MKEQIFRKKSIDKINSPESLDEYIRVPNPPAVLLIAAAAILLIGAFIWFFFGQNSQAVNVTLNVCDKNSVCVLTQEEADKTGSGMNVKSDGFEGRVIRVTADDNGSPSALIYFDAPDGVYEAKISDGKNFSFTNN